MILAKSIIDTLSTQNQTLMEGDILVIAHKVVSKSEGACAYLDEITPSERSDRTGKNCQ